MPPLVEEARFDPAASADIQRLAGGLIAKVRGGPTQMFGVEALMKEFSLSSPEGVALMCLAESLCASPTPTPAIFSSATSSATAIGARMWGPARHGS